MEPINLQRLSSISIAIQIWENNNIKDQVRELFLDLQTHKFKLRDNTENRSSSLTLCRSSDSQLQALYKDFKLIQNSAVLNLNQIQLSTILRNLCEDFVRELGDKIYNWCEYVTETLEFDFKFSEKIYWKFDGTIDEDKIFSTWEDDQDFLNYKSNKGIPAMYILASVNVREEFITNNHVEMEEYLRTHMEEFELRHYTNKVYTLISMYLCLHIYNRGYHIISPHDIFLLCAREGYIKAAMYFWQFIPNTSLPAITRECLKETLGYHTNKCQIDKSVQSILFLIDQMTIGEKDAFLRDGENVGRLFCRILPIRPNCELIFDLIDNYFLSLLIHYYQQILKKILFFIRENEFESSKSKLQCYCLLFDKILTKLPENLKKKVFNVEFFMFPSLIVFNIKILKLIINSIDPKLRPEILPTVQHEVMLLAKSGKIEKVKEFMTEVLISDSERNYCKESILNGYFEFIHAAKFEELTKVLEMLCLSAEEITAIKRKADILTTCRGFIMLEYRYDIGEKYLEWIFSNEEEKENFKESLEADFFIRERTFESCNTSFLISLIGPEANREDFYNFFLGFPEEEKPVKNSEMYSNFREKVSNLNLDKKTTYLKGLSSNNLLFEAVNFLPRSKLDYFGDKYEQVDIFLKWICKNKDQRSALSRKYISARDKDFLYKLVSLMLYPLCVQKLGGW